MGEAPSQKEHILCLLPFPEDTKLLDRIREKHNVEFTYKHITFAKGKALVMKEVPDGSSTIHHQAITLVKLTKKTQN
jgi:hypothetical protein